MGLVGLISLAFTLSAVLKDFDPTTNDPSHSKHTVFQKKKKILFGKWPQPFSARLKVWNVSLKEIVAWTLLFKWILWIQYSILSDYVVDIIIAFCLLTAGAEQAPPWPQNNNKKKKKKSKDDACFSVFLRHWPKSAWNHFVVSNKNLAGCFYNRKN